MKVVYSDIHRQHEPQHEFSGGLLAPYPECSRRADIIWEVLRQSEWSEIIPPQTYQDSALTQAHDGDYLHFLRHAHASLQTTGQDGDLIPSVFAHGQYTRAPAAPYAQAGYYGFDTTPITKGTWSAARSAAHCALTAADLLLAGERVVYSLCRPPGHHAGRRSYGGYCYLNNAALAAYQLSAHGRVAVLDIDYHHGNGTQDIFYSSDQVFFASLHADPAHQYPLYWGYANERGADEGEGYNCNMPLPSGTNDEAYLNALDSMLENIAVFSPAYLIVSAGLDIYKEDPLGDFFITLGGLERIGERLAQCRWPVLLVQEGGYNLSQLGEAAVHLLSPLA